MRLLLPCLVILIGSSPTLAQKTKDHTAIVAEIAENIESAEFGRPTVRLAVVTFVPLQTSGNVFGEYLSESIVGRLSTHAGKLKLFERKRIDAILKENEFMLSGMMKASEAIRIGELLPIDAIFSGTYTRLKNYVDVTGRLIDVASGEILMSYSGRIRLTRNIKTLFPESAVAASTPEMAPANNPNTAASPPRGESADEMCRASVEKFRTKLQDLSTPDKIDAVTAEAMRTPFDNRCGKLHYHLINALTRYSITPDRYKAFLLATLDTIAYPSGDDRAYSILSYVTSDRHVDDGEWRVGIATIRKVGDHTLSAYLGFLFNRLQQPDTAVERGRVNQYLSLLTSGQIGLPRAVSFDRGFYELMESLTANNDLRRYAYGRYGNRLQTEPDNVTGLHLMYLRRMYDDETDEHLKTQVVHWIADYFNNHQNKKSSDQLYTLARDFMPYPNDEGSQFKIDKNKEAASKYPGHDLAILVERCRNLFASYAVDSPYPSQRQDRIDFCVRTGIPIPGVIPSIEEAKAVLSGGDVAEQHRLMKLLLMMGDRVAPLEPVLLSMLSRRSLDHKEQLADVQAMALQLLGTLRTHDPTAIRHMIASLKNYDKAGEISQESLVSVGKPAVGPLTEALNATTIHEGGFQYRLVVILGRIGKDARASAPALRSLLAKTSNKDIRYAIEAALQAFGM